jgi:hypothetical protein
VAPVRGVNFRRLLVRGARARARAPRAAAAAPRPCLQLPAAHKAYPLLRRAA